MDSIGFIDEPVTVLLDTHSILQKKYIAEIEAEERKKEKARS